MYGCWSYGRDGHDFLCEDEKFFVGAFPRRGMRGMRYFGAGGSNYELRRLLALKSVYSSR